MIKFFKLNDLIKYFFKFIITIIIIIICLNIFIKKGEREQQKLQDKELKDAETIENNKSKESINTQTADDNKNKDNNNDGTKEKNKKKNKKNNNSNAYYFCINSEIVDLKDVKDETKINFTSLLKKIIQSEFVILN